MTKGIICMDCGKWVFLSEISESEKERIEIMGEARCKDCEYLQYIIDEEFETSRR